MAKKAKTSKPRTKEEKFIALENELRLHFILYCGKQNTDVLIKKVFGKNVSPSKLAQAETKVSYNVNNWQGRTAENARVSIPFLPIVISTSNTCLVLHEEAS